MVLGKTAERRAGAGYDWEQRGKWGPSAPRMVRMRCDPDVNGGPSGPVWTFSSASSPDFVGWVPADPHMPQLAPSLPRSNGHEWKRLIGAPASATRLAIPSISGVPWGTFPTGREGFAWEWTKLFFWHANQHDTSKIFLNNQLITFSYETVLQIVRLLVAS